MNMSEQDMQYLQRVSNHTLLTKEEEVLCAKTIQRYGETSSRRAAAIEKLIVHNQKLVIKQAYAYHRLAPSIPVMDFFGAGNQGLMEAAVRYDPSKFDTRFSTYALPRILCPVRKMINRAGRVTVPYYLRQLQSQYFRLIESGELNDQEIMKKLKIDETLLAKIRGCEINTVFLDECDEDGNSLSDVIADENKVLPDGNAARKNLIELLNDAIDELDIREQYVINNRLLTEQAMTLEEISKKFNITRERVRQIQREAVKKLKWILKRKGLDEYIEAIPSR